MEISGADPGINLFLLSLLQALIEEYVLKLFAYADAEDRAERFNKNVIKVRRRCRRKLN